MSIKRCIYTVLLILIFCGHNQKSWAIFEKEKPSVENNSLDEIAISYYKLPVDTTAQDLTIAKYQLLEELFSKVAANITTSIRYLHLRLNQNSPIHPLDRLFVKNELAKIHSLFEDYLIRSFSGQSEQLSDLNKEDLLLHLIERILFISEYSLDYLNACIHQNFIKTAPYNFIAHLQNNNPKKVTLAYIHSILHKNTLLEKNIRQLGLSKKNKLFRVIENNIGPARRFLYEFPIGTALGSGILLATYLSWMNGKFNLDKILGEFPQYGKKFDPVTQTFAENVLINNPWWPGACVDLLKRMHIDPIVGGIAGFFFAQISQTGNSTKEKFKQYGQKILNKMRGGAFEDLNIAGNFEFVPRYTLDDITGCDWIKDKLKTIVQCFANPEQFQISSEKRSMLYIFSGESRSGKTFTFEGLSGTIKGINPKANIWVIDYNTVMNIGFKKILEAAKVYAPIILFFDEVHLLRLQETGNKALLQEFLTSLGNSNDSDPTKPIAIIMATTDEHHLNNALKKRFEIIRFELPTLDDRKRFLQKELQKYGLDPMRFDIESIAQKTHGKTFSHLAYLISQGTIKAWIEGRIFTQDIIDEIFNTTIRKVVPQSAHAIEDIRILKELATYLAGQAVMATTLKTIFPIDGITLDKVSEEIEEEFDLNKKSTDDVQSDQYGSLFRRQLYETRDLSATEEIKNEIKITLAGQVALELINGSPNYSIRKNDEQKAFSLIKKLTNPPVNFSSANMIAKEESATLASYHQYRSDVKAILLAQKERIELISFILIHIGTVNASLLDADIAQLQTIKHHIEEKQLKG